MKPLIREIAKGEGREARIRELKPGGMRPTDIARTLGIGRSSVYEADRAATLGHEVAVRPS